MSEREQMAVYILASKDISKELGWDFIVLNFNDADRVVELLKEQQETASEWLEDSDPGQVYGTTWACFKCKHGIHKPFVWNPYDSKMVYCPFCGARMYREVKTDA